MLGIPATDKSVIRVRWGGGGEAMFPVNQQYPDLFHVFNPGEESSGQEVISVDVVLQVTKSHI